MKPTAKTTTPISPVRDRMRLARISIEKGSSLFSPGKVSAPTIRMRTETSIAEMVEKAIPLWAESKVLPFDRKLLRLIKNKLSYIVGQSDQFLKKELYKAEEIYPLIIFVTDEMTIDSD